MKNIQLPDIEITARQQSLLQWLLVCAGVLVVYFAAENVKVPLMLIIQYTQKALADNGQKRDVDGVLLPKPDADNHPK